MSKNTMTNSRVTNNTMSKNTMTNSRVTHNTMGKSRVGNNTMSKSRVGNNWMSNSMGNRVSNNRVGNGRVSNNWVGYSRVGNNSRSCSIGRNSIIGDISNISIIVIGVVGDCLGTTIRESHRVGARLGTSTITALSSLEVRARVVISYSVVVVVGGDP